MPPTVTAVHLSSTHSFSKQPQLQIHLIAQHGVEGDAHAGPLTQHLYLQRKDPTQPNLCQVHLLQSELLDELSLAPGQMGENITTRNLDLIHLPTGTLLQIGPTVVLEVTGLRSPCNQINQLHPGRKPSLMQTCFLPPPAAKKQPRAGIMSIVLTGGDITPGDPIRITLPPEPHRPLPCV